MDNLYWIRFSIFDHLHTTKLFDAIKLVSLHGGKAITMLALPPRPRT